MSSDLLRGFLCSVDGDFREITITDELHEFYRVLDCDLIDITQVSVGGFVYDVVCDDEGLLKDGCIPTIVCPDRVLVGNCFVCRPPDPGSGVLRSLTDIDVEVLRSRVVPVPSDRFGVDRVLVAFGDRDKVLLSNP